MAEELPPKIAYSYVRFSRLHQADGDSIRRQRKATEQYCKDNNLRLDTSLTLKDEGVSAFKGRNAKKGALGKFLSMVESGAVPPGSALVVEALDRMSRETPRRALSLITQLLDAGIEVHLTMAKTVLSPDSKSEGFDLMMALAKAIQAHGESADKSRRLKDAFAEKRRKARQEGEFISTSLPWWLVWENGKCSKIVCPEERREVVVRIFEETAAGYSSSKIARKLAAEGVPTWRPKNKSWVAARVRDLVRWRAPEGVLEATAKTIAAGRGHKIEGYYPQIISAELAAAARATLKRNLVKGRVSLVGRPSNLLRGIVRAKGHWMRFACHPNGKRNKDGVKTFNWYYEEWVEVDGKMGITVSGKQLEGVLLAGLSEIQEADLRPRKSVPIIIKTTKLEKKVSELKTRISNLVEAVGSGSISIANRVVELERELKVTLLELEDARAAERISVDATPVREIKGLDLENLEQREQLTAAIHRLISRVDVGQKISDLPDRVKVSQYILKGAGETFYAPDTTPARRKPIWLLVSFVGGGKRLIIRDPKFGERIISTRWEPDETIKP